MLVYVDWGDWFLNFCDIFATVLCFVLEVGCEELGSILEQEGHMNPRFFLPVRMSVVVIYTIIGVQSKERERIFFASSSKNLWIRGSFQCISPFFFPISFHYSKMECFG